MLAQILVAILVVAVAVMVARDLVRTKSEGPLGLPDGSGYEIHPRTIGDTHGDRTGTSYRDFYGTGVPAAGFDAAPASPARQDRVPAEQGKRHVRARLVWLVVIPAAAVAAIALCIVGLAYELSPARINSSSSSVHDESILWAVALGVVIIVVLALAVRATIATGRSVLRPLYMVRARALALADGRPSNAAGAEMASPDEIGDIARALERVRGMVSRLGGDEAGLRGKLDAMFVNLSQRGQSLAERQMRLIEHLEQGEHDRERRASLFRMNRIAARMYRNSQNLLILAGHELSSGWNQPLALMNVIRAAVSEVEENERVSVLAQPEIALYGPAVYDVVHLLAELIQNATSFSAVDMPVEISGQLLNTGGALISITDRGVGMGAQEIAHANWRLENPPPAEIDVPKWIGLFVVARLAARRGVRVRLKPGDIGGLTALVWLPNELISRTDPAVPAGLASAGPGGSRRGAHEAAMGPGGVTTQPGVAMARMAQAAPSGNQAMSPLLGRRLLPEERRQPGSAAAAAWPPGSAAAAAWPPGSAAAAAGPRTIPPAGPRTIPPADPAAAADDGVIVPPTEAATEERRLPIFDSVESHWFSGGRRTPSPPRTAENPWSSPADEGWRAAKTVESPAAGSPTPAGLPQRVPNANLVPGAIPGAQQPAALPARSPAEARDRLAGLQRGAAEGRTAASEAGKPAGEDEP